MHMLRPGKDTGTIRSDIFVYHLKYSGVYASVYILNYRLLLSINYTSNTLKSRFTQQVFTQPTVEKCNDFLLLTPKKCRSSFIYTSVTNILANSMYKEKGYIQLMIPSISKEKSRQNLEQHIHEQEQRGKSIHAVCLLALSQLSSCLQSSASLLR